TDRDNTARVSRPDTVLGPGRSRAQAGSLPSVLQPVSLSHRTGRAHAGSKERCTFASDRMPRFVSLAPTLRRPLSDPGCRLNWNSPHTLQICPDSKICIPQRLFQTTGSPSSRNPIRTSTWKVGSPALFTEPRIFLTSNQSIFRIVWRALIIALRTACWTLSSETPTTSIILYVLFGTRLSFSSCASPVRDAPVFGSLAALFRISVVAQARRREHNSRSSGFCEKPARRHAGDTTAVTLKTPDFSARSSPTIRECALHHSKRRTRAHCPSAVVDATCHTDRILGDD